MNVVTRLLLSLLGLLLVASLVWLCWPERPAAAPEPAAGAAPDAPAPPAPKGDAPQRLAVDVPDTALRLCGRVLDPFGEPLAGALVGDVAAALPTRTAADGSFALPVDPAAASLLVLAAAQAPLLVPLELAGATGERDLGDLVLPNGGGVRGRVLGSGRPLPGAAVTLRLIGGVAVPAALDFARLLPKAATGADGGYVLAGLLPGRYRVQVEHPGMQRGQSATFAVAEGKQVAVEPIDLAPGWPLDGVVLGPDGAPVGGASVQLQASQPRLTASAESAADGSFHFDALPPGTLRVEAQRPGFLPARAEVDAARGERLVLQLGAGLQVRGIAVDAASGRPVERFALAVRRLGDLDPGGNGTVDQQLQRRIAALRAPAAEADAAQRQAIAGELEARRQALLQPELPPAPPPGLGAEQVHAGGEFCCDGLDEGLYAVGVASPAHRYAESAAFELRAGAPPPQLRLLLASGPRLRGVVVRQRDGAPVAGARVELLWPTQAGDAAQPLYPWAFAKGTPGIALLATKTGGDGGFAFPPAAAGSWCLSVRGEAIADAEQGPFVLQGEGLQLRVEVGERCSLSGRVRGADPRGTALLLLGGHGTLRDGRPQPDGSYRFDGLQPGSYLVRAFPADSRRYRERLLGSIFPLHAGAVDRDAVRCDVELLPGEQRVLDLEVDRPAAGSVGGSLTVDGRPLPGCRAVLQPVPGEAPGSGGLPLRADADESGRFAFADVPAGNYLLLLYGPGRQELHRQPLAVAPSAHAEVAATASAGGLRGRVTATGVAAADLRGYVWVLPGAEAAPDDLYEYRRQQRVHRLSLRDGAFAEAVLTPGPALVVADVRGQPRAVAKVVVPIGGTAELEIPLGGR